MNASATTAKQFVTEKGEPIFGIMAEFATPADVYHAAEKIRDAGYTKWDLYSPFPIHGIDEAMGITRTKLPLIVGAAAIVGGAVAAGCRGAAIGARAAGEPPTRCRYTAALHSRSCPR